MTCPGRPDLTLGERVVTGGLDWTRVVELALRHRLTPPLLALLESIGNPAPPLDLLQALREHDLVLRQQQADLLRELFALLDALTARQIRAVPFKGPLLGELLFGEAALRAPGDLDILVGLADVDGTLEVLESRGFVDAARLAGAAALTPTQHLMYRKVQCEYLYIRERDGLVVEPHWALCQAPLAVDVDYAGMLARAVPATLGGRTVSTLAPGDLLVALCIHGAKHRWMRLAWIRDIAALLRRWPSLDLPGLLEQARSRGYQRVLLLGLAVAHDITGSILPASIVRRFESEPHLARLRLEVRAGLFGPVDEDSRNDGIEPFRFWMRERPIDRARYVLRTWLTPARPHLQAVDLPHSLRFGYYGVKIGIDFALMPVWRGLGRIIWAKIRPGAE